MKHSILFAHAVSGCDTTSCFFKKGKLATFKALEKDPRLRQITSIFLDPAAEKCELVKAGETFLFSLYGRHRLAKDLGQLRYYKYKTLTSRQVLSKNFELATLPPTTDAAENHYYRTYLQIQFWLNNEKDATHWGWNKKTDMLVPKTMSKAVAPDFVLKMIYCNCKSGCNKLCTCLKSNMPCSSLCGNCNGISCDNKQMSVDEEQIE